MQTIIQAREVASTFPTVMLPDPRPLLSFQVNYLPDEVQIQALAASFTTVAHNSLQRSIGRYLDRALPLAQGDFSMMIAEFQSLTDPQFDAAFTSLSLSIYDADALATVNLTREYVRSLQQHMVGSRIRQEMNPTPVNGGPSGKQEQAGMRLQRGRTWQPDVWLSGLGAWEDQETQPDGFSGFNSSAGGGGSCVAFFGTSPWGWACSASSCARSTSRPTASCV